MATPWAAHDPDDDPWTPWILENPLGQNLWRVIWQKRSTGSGGAVDLQQTVHPGDNRTVEVYVYTMDDWSRVLAPYRPTRSYFTAFNLPSYMRRKIRRFGLATMSVDEFHGLPTTPVTHEWVEGAANEPRPTYGCLFRRQL